MHSKSSIDEPAAAAPARRNGERTRTLILDAAETLFSEHGLDGVSMRAIAASAGVTLALVNYHFGSKDGLYRAAFERRGAPLAQSRRAALAAVLGQEGCAPAIGDVLDALARPWVEMRGQPGGLAYARLIAREVSDPAEGKRSIVPDLLDPVALEFIDAMKKALPTMPASKVAWAYHFFIGALLLILSNPDRVTRLSGQLCSIKEDRAVIDEIVSFFSNALELATLPRKEAAIKPKRPVSAKTVKELP